MVTLLVAPKALDLSAIFFTEFEPTVFDEADTIEVVVWGAGFVELIFFFATDAVVLGKTDFED